MGGGRVMVGVDPSRGKRRSSSSLSCRPSTAQDDMVLIMAADYCRGRTRAPPRVHPSKSGGYLTACLGALRLRGR